ncbi:hypothetical protein, partial [Mycobacteroides abscessus]|uniref:hypothetical protein n=1 Tax=Mycobacteroides abscessus TaxID=36809 RepID=UPI0019504D1E
NHPPSLSQGVNPSPSLQGHSQSVVDTLVWVERLESAARGFHCRADILCACLGEFACRKQALRRVSAAHRVSPFAHSG